MAYKEILENATSAKSFSLNEDCLAIEDHVNSNITSSLKILKAKLPEKLYRYFKSAVIRSSFFMFVYTVYIDFSKYRTMYTDNSRPHNCNTLGK